MTLRPHSVVLVPFQVDYKVGLLADVFVDFYSTIAESAVDRGKQKLLTLCFPV